MIPPETMARLAAALCAPVLARLIEEALDIAISLVRQLATWLTYPPASFRLHEVLHCVAQRSAFPAAERRWAARLLLQESREPPFPHVQIQYTQACLDREIDELRGFRLPMLRHLPKRAVRATTPQVFLDLAKTYVPTMIPFLQTEIIALAELLLEELHPRHHAGEQIYHALLLTRQQRRLRRQ